MLKSLIRNSDFKSLSDFVSPHFFKVVPVGQCFKIISKVFLDARSQAKNSAARESVRSCLQPLGVIVTEDCAIGSAALGARSAEIVLQCYFRQILKCDTWLLDFRKERWKTDATGLLWNPSPYFFVPSDSFRKAVIGLYVGFYDNDHELFKRSLKTLGLAEAEGNIRKHFGLDGQSTVLFSLPDLQNSFSEIFLACAKSGATIHPEFALLGAMLLSLYDVLETAGPPLDVRKAFDLARAPELRPT